MEIFRFENVKYKNILNIPKLSIEMGKTTCIAGSSGSGKTSLLLLLNKMISPSYGEIYFKGKNIKEIDAINLRREVVMLGQESVVFEGNVRENLNIGRIFSDKNPLDDINLNKVLEYIELKKKLEDDPSLFSGGEKQRLAIARVLLMEPEVYLFDEPSSALDSRLAMEIAEKLAIKSSKNNKTVIMVTHSKKILGKFADRLIEVKEGRVVRNE